MNCNEYLTLAPSELLEVLSNTFIVEIPEAADNDIETLKDVSTMMGEAVNQYSFLVQLYCMAKVSTRQYKRLGKDAKKEYEDLVDKKEIIKNILDAVLLRYKALSRMITVKQEVNNEINMSESR